MAEIQGRIQGNIGADDVNLVTNAATEFTLRQLLQATLAIGTKNEKALTELAKSAGYDADAIAQLNQGTQQTGISMGKLEMGARAVEAGFRRVMPYVHMFEGALSKLSDNSGKASEQFKSFERLGLGFGAIAEKYGKLMAFQEANMAVYQKLTTVGVNLGGSLSDVRNSAGSMYLTLDQFSKIMTENGPAFARLGGTVDQGARAFIDLSKNLNKSGSTEKLMSLGYTAEEVNQGLINYLSSSGTRTRQELENTGAITKSTVEYLTELDKLTQFTGVSKKKLEEDQKKASLNEAFQRKLAGLDEAERVKLKAAYDKASASGIEGATDLVMSTALKLPPVTESARNLQGLASGVANGFKNMTNSAMTAGTTLEDQRQIYGETLIAARDQSKQQGIVGDYLVASGNKLGTLQNSLMAVENQLRGKGIDSANGVAEEFDKIKKQQTDQQKSEAATQSKIQVQMYEASAALNAAIQALVRDAMPGMTTAIKEFTDAVKSMSGVVEQSPSAFNYLYNTLAIIGGAATAVGGLITAQRIKGIMGKPGGGVGGLIPETLGGNTKTVGVGGTIIDSTTGKPFASAEKSVLKTAAMESESVLSGLSKTAAKMVKPLAGIGTILTVGMAAGDYADIEKSRKQGKISDEEAGTKKGGVVGGAIGGLSGAAAGAAAGAAIGAAFFGVGAAPGAIIGGLLGGWLGDKEGTKIGESMGTKDTTAIEQTKTKKEEQEKNEMAKARASEENLLVGINRLNTTMDKILTEIKATATATEATNKSLNNTKFLRTN